MWSRVREFFSGRRASDGAKRRKSEKNSCLDEKLAIDVASLSCPICYTCYFETPKVLPCGHSICAVCLRRLAASGNANFNYGQCPFCRSPYRCSNLPKNFALETILDGVSSEIEELFGRSLLAEAALAGSLDSEVSAEPQVETLAYADFARRRLVEGNLRFENQRLTKRLQEANGALAQTREQMEQLSAMCGLLKGALFAVIALGVFKYVQVWQQASVAVGLPVK